MGARSGVSDRAGEGKRKFQSGAVPLRAVAPQELLGQASSACPGAAEPSGRAAPARAVPRSNVLLYMLLRAGPGAGGEKEKALMGDGLVLMSPNLFHKLSEIF